MNCHLRRMALVFVVDCGSRSSRIFSYSRNFPQSAASFVGEIGALHAELSQKKADKFVDELMTIITSCDKYSREKINEDSIQLTDTRVAIIATGGMRNALNDGTVSNQDLQDFQQQIKTKFLSNNNVVTYETLDGEEEAALERAACLYALDAFKISFGEELSILTPEKVSIVSMGGASFQISTEHNTLSVDAGIRYVRLKGKETVEFLKLFASCTHTDDYIDAVKNWENVTSKCVKDSLLLSTKQNNADLNRLNDLYIGTATTYWAAKDCEMEDKFMKVSEVIETVTLKIGQIFKDDEFIKKVKDETKKGEYKAIEKISRMNLLREILIHLCSEKSQIIFRRRWNDTDKDITTNLPFGKFLQIISSKDTYIVTDRR